MTDASFYSILMLLFVIALQSPQASKDWSLVSRLWERTLRSICAQTGDAFRVFLVCNERPKIAFDHPNLTVIEEDFPLPEANTPSRMRDKWAKIRRGLVAAREYAPAHVMVMDADDCVHRGLAEFAAAHPHENGWLFESGYVRDEGRSWVYARKQFDRVCGTSAIVRLEEHDFPSDMYSGGSYFILENGHGVIGDFCRTHGRPLAPLPFVGAVYNVGTGENDSGFSLRGWHSKKVFLKKIIHAKWLTKQRREAYGLYDLTP